MMRSAASFRGVWLNFGKRVKANVIGGDMPNPSSKESSAWTLGVVEGLAEGLNPERNLGNETEWLRDGVVTVGLLRSTIPPQSEGFESGGRYGLRVFINGVFGLNFRGETTRLEEAVERSYSAAFRFKTLCRSASDGSLPLPLSVLDVGGIARIWRWVTSSDSPWIDICATEEEAAETASSSLRL